MILAQKWPKHGNNNPVSALLNRWQVRVNEVCELVT